MCKPGNACGCSGSGSGGGLLTLLVAAVVAAVFVLAHLLALAAATVALVVGTFGAVRLLTRYIVPGSRPRPQARTLPAVRRAITAGPRAIEAGPAAALPGIVVAGGDFLTGTPATPVEPSHAIAG